MSDTGSPREDLPDGSNDAEAEEIKAEEERAEEERAEKGPSMVKIIRIQSMIRRYLNRVRTIQLLRSRYEKIYDIKRNRFYYYDTITDMSSWRKHRLFGRHDVEFISPMYTEDMAAEMIQKQMRRYMALMRVRLMYQRIVSAIPDARTSGTYYYNSELGQAMWELPKFMKGKLTHKRRADRRLGDSSEEDSDGDGGSGGSDSEAEKLRRKMARKYPR